MKKLLYCTAMLVMAMCFALTSCHSNEKNYKAAYDKAMEKYKSGIGAEMYENIQAERRRSTTVIDGDSVRLLRMYANVYDDSTSVAHLYNIVVAEFTQEINAKSYRDRLRREEGHPSYVLYGGADKKYYVVVRGYEDASQAAEFLKNIDKNVKIKLLVPRAWILLRM